MRDPSRALIAEQAWAEWPAAEPYKWEHRDAFMAGYLAAVLTADPTLGGKLHQVHGGAGTTCWCGYIGHEASAP
jgi:hypothetical protein